jgi:hypothetical protein
MWLRQILLNLLSNACKFSATPSQAKDKARPHGMKIKTVPGAPALPTPVHQNTATPPRPPTTEVSKPMQPHRARRITRQLEVALFIGAKLDLRRTA